MISSLINQVYFIQSDKFVFRSGKLPSRTLPRFLALAGWLGVLGTAGFGGAAQISNLKTYFLPTSNQARIPSTEDNLHSVFVALGTGRLIDAPEFQDLVPPLRDQLPASVNPSTVAMDPGRMNGLLNQATLLTRLILFFNEVAEQPGVSVSDRRSYYYQVILHCQQFFEWRDEVMAPTNGPLSSDVTAKLQEFTSANLTSWGQATDFRNGDVDVCKLYQDHPLEEFGKSTWRVFRKALILDSDGTSTEGMKRMKRDVSDPDKRLWWEKFVKVQNDLVHRGSVRFSEMEQRELTAIIAALDSTSPAPALPAPNNP